MGAMLPTPQAQIQGSLFASFASEKEALAFDNFTSLNPE
jgi:hypothetical protein